MPDKPHWSTGLSLREKFDQANAAFIHDNDYERCHSDGELLEFLEVFNDALPETDIERIRNHNQYLIPHQNNITIALTADHIGFICQMLEDWDDDNDLEN